MIFEFSLQTSSENFHNITQEVRDALKESKIESGICTIYCPHTTAGITINEAADPDVIDDMVLALKKFIPDMREFKHYEGNSSAHIKASLIGSSVQVIVENNKLLLGTWQGIYFTEFDGPRHRKYFVKIVSDK